MVSEAVIVVVIDNGGHSPPYEMIEFPGPLGQYFYWECLVLVSECGVVVQYLETSIPVVSA